MYWNQRPGERSSSWPGRSSESNRWALAANAQVSTASTFMTTKSTLLRSTADVAAQPIKANRELRKDDAYIPTFVNYPISISDIPVSLSSDDQAMLDELLATGDFGSTEDDVLRYVFFSWWIPRFMQGPKHFNQSASS